MAIWNRFQSLIFGGAIGAGARVAIEPQIEPARQHAWSKNQNRILDPNTVAQLVAQGATGIDVAAAIATRNGFDGDKFKALVHLALKAPPYAEVLDLWRRNPTRPPDEQISEAQVEHALAKAQIEEQYWPALKELVSARLDPAIIATAIQRGIMRDPGFLPVGPPTTEGKVKAFPVSPLDPLDEAASQGVNADRLFVETALVGNPLPPHEGAQAVFREIIDRIDFDRLIAEGRTRNEWADAFFEVARQIPTAHDGIEGRLRGWLTDAEMYAQTARHGMSQADTDLLLKVTGRPMAPRQVFVALRRGGTYNGPTTDLEPPFLKALQESNVRPEWYNLEWAYRFTQPSVFVIRQWLKDGGDPEWARTKLFYEGWEESDIDKFVAEYTAVAAAAKQDPAIKSAETRFLTALHKAFVKGGITDAQAVAELQLTSLTTAEQAGVMNYWRKEKDLEAIPPPPAA